MSEHNPPSLCEEQRRAVANVLDWLAAGARSIAIRGPAGSGKTTLVRALREALGYNLSLAASTNNAARLLSKKTGAPVKTLHKRCCRPVFSSPVSDLQRYWQDVQAEKKLLPIKCPAIIEAWGEAWLESVSPQESIESILRALQVNAFNFFLGWEAADPQPGILLCDEASMLTEQQVQMALTVFEQIILVGDHRQLPPVRQEREQSVLDLAGPQNTVTLSTVHRQADGSSVLDSAYAAYHEGVITGPKRRLIIDELRDGVPLLVWKNSTRLDCTLKIRRMLGRNPEAVEVGECILIRDNAMCLVTGELVPRNSLWTVNAISSSGIATLQSGNDVVQLRLCMEELGQIFGTAARFAYVMTVHNAQGLEWSRVAIHYRDAVGFRAKQQQFRNPEQFQRWLYTAITRARDEIIFATGLSAKPSHSGVPDAVSNPTQYLKGKKYG